MHVPTPKCATLLVLSSRVVKSLSDPPASSPWRPTVPSTGMIPLHASISLHNEVDATGNCGARHEGFSRGDEAQIGRGLRSFVFSLGFKEARGDIFQNPEHKQSQQLDPPPKTKTKKNIVDYEPIGSTRPNHNGRVGGNNRNRMFHKLPQTAVLRQGRAPRVSRALSSISPPQSSKQIPGINYYTISCPT